MTDVGSV